MTIRIYYLDDEINFCNVFKEYISNKHIEVETFMDATEAISRCIAEPPDMIFIDYRLKDTTGDIVASMLDKDLRKVLVTGELELPDNEQFIQVVAKPYKLAMLKAIIEAQLGSI